MKIIEGSNFREFIIKQKMFLDPKLGSTDEVRSDLRGHLEAVRGCFSFEPSKSHRRKRISEVYHKNENVPRPQISGYG